MNQFTQKLCIRCHSIQGVGGTTGPDLGEIWLGSFMDIASKLWNHFPRMTSRGTCACARRSAPISGPVSRNGMWKDIAAL